MSEKAAENVAAPASTDTSNVSKEELLELVCAIKFAKPNASIRNVHQEITQILAKKESFEFLANVKLNDVKRVWKKAQQPASRKDEKTDAATAASKELKQRLPEGVVQLYTVGDGNSIQTLARNYTAAAAAEAAAKEAQLEQEQEEELKNYVHVFLDVPGDFTGSRPHQALITFHKQEKKKGNEDSHENNSNIVKIQMAALSADEEHEKYPMLLYNQDRSAKTFIHYDANDDTNSYQRIQEWISKSGVHGALGNVGGTKAYFYSVITKRRNGPDIISINVSELAPPQEW